MGGTEPMSFKISTLGENGLLVQFGNEVNETLNDKVQSLQQLLTDHPLPGTIDLVPAYSSLAVYFDPAYTAGSGTDTAAAELEKFTRALTTASIAASRFISIPVCYEPAQATDLLAVSRATGLTVEEVIAIHSAPVYRVYMMGFLPGFAYMGPLDARIRLPRKSKPARVPAGSIAIAANQTGIYPFSSPGGWHTIGRTPLRLFDADAEEPCSLRSGDQVKFEPISPEEYKNMLQS